LRQGQFQYFPNVFLLPLSYLLLEAENVFVEVELQLFVAKVDAQLLERVLLERLEPEDVQHPNDVGVARGGLRLLQRHVDLVDDRLEQVPIKGLHQSITSFLSLLHRIRDQQHRPIVGVEIGMMVMVVDYDV